MARAAVASEEYAAVRLLIGTWDSIATRVLAGDIPMIPFFQSNPVSHMWDALKDGIYEIRERSKGPTYATDFEALFNAFDDWLKTKDGKKYKTAAAQGINAHFG